MIKKEEDYKVKYMEALGYADVSHYNVGRIDVLIDTGSLFDNLVAIEFKDDNTSDGRDLLSQIAMTIYKAYYIDKTLKRMPMCLVGINRETAYFYKLDGVRFLFTYNAPYWNECLKQKGSRPSNLTEQTKDEIWNFVKNDVKSFNANNQKMIKDYINQLIKNKLNNGKIVIDKVNFPLVFDMWKEYIGNNLKSYNSNITIEHLGIDYSLLFINDFLRYSKDVTIGLDNDELAAMVISKNSITFVIQNLRLDQFNIDRKIYENFWNVYDRPPSPEDVKIVRENRHALIPVNDRKRKGAEYTPKNFAKKACEYLKDLKVDWSEYILWDMCAGVGNLQESLDFIPRENIYLSTLDYIDVDTLQKKKDKNGDNIFYKDNCFQYDYLNDDIIDGEIVYKEIKNDKGEITKIRKLPLELEKAIKNKKVLVFINPPYKMPDSEEMSGLTGTGVKKQIMLEKYGGAVNELYTQFLARIQFELPNCLIGMFSTLKHISGSDFATFRKIWQPKYLGGFIMNSKNFELAGDTDFPISFLMWDTSKNEEIKKIKVDILNDKTAKTGTEIFCSYVNGEYINDWVNRIEGDGTEGIPLSNALTLFKGKKPIIKQFHKKAIGYANQDSSDFQHNRTCYIMSSVTANHLGGTCILKENLSQICVYDAIRHSINLHWTNNRDQFLRPHTEPTEEFTNDCIAMTLFANSNLAACGDLQYKIDKKHPDGIWHLTNHWIPFSQEQLGRIKLESTFMSDFIKDKKFSTEAQNVLDEGLRIWRFYLQNYRNFTNTNQGDIELQLSDNAGWYQIRMALQNNGYTDELNTLKELQIILNEKIVDEVYKFGFLLK